MMRRLFATNTLQIGRDKRHRRIKCRACCLTLGILSLILTVATAARGSDSGPPSERALNVLLLTADDLGYSSLGVTGCKVANITPNLDRLASQGILFHHAHVTVSVCQPCRQVLMTGRYPHNNGALGFEPIRRDVPTLQESLEAAGYLNGIIGKSEHLQPREKFNWAFEVASTSERSGREPKAYYRYTKAFLEHAKGAGRPFFLMANTTDPHRPFPGTEREKMVAERFKATFPDVRKHYRPDEIHVPGFLPDLPEVRDELAAYYTSVHRCDECIGEVLRALTESNLDQNTLVLFLSDHGMAFPFAKGNCYRASTRTPCMVRWPGTLRPGSVDRKHFISGIDFMPTILDALKLNPVEGLDGRSFLSLLQGESQEDRQRVMTVYNRTTGKGRFLPMRCIREKRFAYIWNPWSDGKQVHSAAAGGRTLPAMIRAAKSGNRPLAERVRLSQYRVREEFFDYQDDPYSLKNLIDNPKYKNEVDRLRSELAKAMRASSDPLLEQFQREAARPRPN